MIGKIALLLHLVGFAAYTGAGFAQLRLLRASVRDGLAAPVRDAYESLAATVVTRIELPAIMVSVASGIAFVALAPGWLEMGWLRLKLVAVLALLVLSHLEMFNARAIVRARAEEGDRAKAEIARRKKRHELFGAVGAASLVALVGLVVFGR